MRLSALAALVALCVIFAALMALLFACGPSASDFADDVREEIEDHYRYQEVVFYNNSPDWLERVSLYYIEWRTYYYSTDPVPPGGIAAMGLVPVGHHLLTIEWFDGYNVKRPLEIQFLQALYVLDAERE